MPKSHLFLQYNFQKNILWNIKSISQCNDESLKPTSSTEAFYDIIGTLGTVQPCSEPTFPFQYMSNVGLPLLAPLQGEMKICIHYVFVENLILYNFCLKHFSIQSVLLAAFSPKMNLLFYSNTWQLFGAP